MILTISTNKKQEIIDITHKINGLIRKSSIVNGLCHAFVKHTTAALIINENDDPDVCVDFLNALNKVFPDQAGYLHDSVDNNAGAHIKAAMLGPQIAVPIEKGKLALGRWQAIMFAEFDGPREKREIVISLIKTD